MWDTSQPDRRRYPRLKVSVPIEIRADGAACSVHSTTLDLSLGGCYFETIFPFPVGTELDVKLQIDTLVPISAIVVTCDPQVGNGIKFTKMLPEDCKALEAFLQGAEQQQRLAVFAH
ncbi:MAG TPA: PilZ domain-containing protein [Terriglobales bacterium]|nr:PilZ domain-containing protein [Terriglobales bacterium]